jgi:hypothetical protein
MSFSDWDVISGSTSAVLNISLANPLPTGSAGDFCRSFGQNGQVCKVFLNNPDFIGVQDTNAIRIRSCIRRNENTNVYFGGIGAKIDASGFGYKIVYSASSMNYLILYNNGSVASLNHGIVSPLTKWFSFQLDIYPIGSSGDRIIVSKEDSLGSQTYTPILIAGASSAEEGIFIPSSNDARYAPWGLAGRIGFSTNTNLLGSTLVDKFYVALTPAP